MRLARTKLYNTKILSLKIRPAQNTSMHEEIIDDKTTRTTRQRKLYPQAMAAVRMIPPDRRVRLRSISGCTNWGLRKGGRRGLRGTSVRGERLPDALALGSQIWRGISTASSERVRTITRNGPKRPNVCFIGVAKASIVRVRRDSSAVRIEQQRKVAHLVSRHVIF